MIGYEFEFIVREGGRPLSREKFLAFHKVLQAEGWEPVYTTDTRELLGSSKNGIVVFTDDSINIMELNMPPTETVNESDEKMMTLLQHLQNIYKKLGCTIVGTSVYPGSFDIYQPKCKNICESPYVWAFSFTKYIAPQRFGEYHHATFVIAADQIWLDLPENQIIQQLSILNRLSPLLVALFANGPVFNNRQLGVHEGRDKLWQIALDHDNLRSASSTYGMYPVEFNSIFEYFDFILEQPFYFSYRDDVCFKLRDPAKTYKDFLLSHGMEAVYGDGKRFFAEPLPIDFLALQRATYQYARLKYFIKDGVGIKQIMKAYLERNEQAFLNCFSKFCVEMRAIGAQKKDELSVAPALLLGLQEKMDEVETLLSKHPYEFWQSFYSHVQKDALQANHEDVDVCELLDALIATARKGLMQRGKDEQIFLDGLNERIKTRKNPAQELLETWKSERLEGIYRSRDY